MSYTRMKCTYVASQRLPYLYSEMKYFEIHPVYQ